MGYSRGPCTDTNDFHVSVRAISTHYHKIKKFLHGRSPRAQIIIFTSHHPQHGRSPRAQLILNLMSMHVHNIISNKRMIIHLNQSNINNTKPPQLSQLYGCNKENTNTQGFQVNNISANVYMLWHSHTTIHIQL